MANLSISDAKNSSESLNKNKPSMTGLACSLTPIQVTNLH